VMHLLIFLPFVDMLTFVFDHVANKNKRTNTYEVFGDF
jgi:hypothetical protein